MPPRLPQQPMLWFYLLMSLLFGALGNTLAVFVRQLITERRQAARRATGQAAEQIHTNETTRWVLEKTMAARMHKCFREVNRQLEEHGAELGLEQGINFRTGKLTRLELPIVVRKRDSKSRKRLPLVLSTFCPICGERLKPEPKASPANG